MVENVDQIPAPPKSERRLAALTDAQRLACTDADFDGCSVEKALRAFSRRTRLAGSEMAAIISDQQWGKNPQATRERIFICVLLIRRYRSEEAVKEHLYALAHKLAKKYHW